MRTIGFILLSLAWWTMAVEAGLLRGTVRDAASGEALAARIYLRSESGEWFFPRSAVPEGKAIPYQKQRGLRSIEMHTTVSAHPFEVELAPGTYELTVVRGKEYREWSGEVELGSEPRDLTIEMERWINLAELNWYSGETHVHRAVEELPLLMEAENLNVTFPLTDWVSRAYEAPAQSDRSQGGQYPARLIEVDPTHVIWPRNTEYEIVNVEGERHVLGALFVLNHEERLEVGAPPVRPILASPTGKELLDLDKHNWPWSLLLIPLLNVDLFELTNNHVWRTEFAFRDWSLPAPDYMNSNYGTGRATEEGWLQFGFETYYALLNCGFSMMPSAGTASGVHPVPLGFGRVYVHLKDGFQFDEWVAGLKAGRSFVTTGPMLMSTVNGQHPGHRWTGPAKAEVRGKVVSPYAVDRVELLWNGEVVRSVKVRKDVGEWEVDFDFDVENPGWLALRCFESRPGGRTRFAHTAPWHFDFPDRKVAPRREQIDYLIRRTEEQIQRSQGVLSEAALEEYREALEAYRQIGERVSSE